MKSSWLRLALITLILALLTSCGTRSRNAKKVSDPVEQPKRSAFQPVQLMRVFPEIKTERLILTASTFPEGVYVCALENLSKPCLPKLSAFVAAKLAERGIVVETDPAKAEITLYFETWFDTFSTTAEIPHSQETNPARFGQDFAPKIEKSLSTGFLPNVHKRMRDAANPYALVGANANDDQKFIYVAFTAVEMKMAVDFAGDPERNLGPSKNPWPNMSKAKTTWMKAKKAPPMRSLIGNYEGEMPTEKSAMPMLEDGINLLLERVAQAPRKK